jgi:hypothetical protein
MSLGLVYLIRFLCAGSLSALFYRWAGLSPPPQQKADSFCKYDPPPHSTCQKPVSRHHVGRGGGWCTHPMQRELCNCSTCCRDCEFMTFSPHNLYNDFCTARCMHQRVQNFTHGGFWLTRANNDVAIFCKQQQTCFVINNALCFALEDFCQAASLYGYYSIVRIVVSQGHKQHFWGSYISRFCKYGSYYKTTML